MPLPAIIPAAGALAAKFGIGAKLASAFTAAKGLIGLGGAKAAATQLAIPGLAQATATRMGGQKLAQMAVTNPAFKSGIGKALFGTMDKGQIVGRLAPDAFFGGLAALQTPGDLGDKLIAGTTSAVGGGLGGLALGRAGQRFGDTAGFMADMAGSVGGDYAGMMFGDTLQRGKDKVFGGEGQTAYERMSSEQQAQFAEQIRQQTLAGAGLIPGVQDRYFDNTGMM